MDDAHAAAKAGAAAGTLIVADRQTAGRGRGGRVWSSEAGAGLWMTLIERPRGTEVSGVLALRVGMRLAAALDPFVRSPVRLKWPNDLYVGDGKLAGILVEARWRNAAIDWVAIGVGVNMRLPLDLPHVAHVRAGVSRAELMSALVPGMREAVRGEGPLGAEELAAWNERDLSIGRRISRPVRGVVQGVAVDGALLVLEPDHVVATAVRAGSLEFSDLPPY